MEIKNEVRTKNLNTSKNLNQVVSKKLDQIKLDTHVLAIKHDLGNKAIDNHKNLKTNFYKAIDDIKQWNQQTQFSVQVRNVIDLAIHGFNRFIQSALRKDTKDEK